VRLGYFTPDYTAYEDLLTTFPSIDPVHIELTAAHKFKISPAELAERVAGVNFAAKQKLTIDSLTALGVKMPGDPRGTFYAWVDVSGLPGTLNTGEGFMRAAFGHRVLTVPGEFFDVNPRRLRTGESPLKSMVRFSFGPPRANLEAGLSRLAEMVRAAK
jgi:aspartate/methionine/tyrosine aminotransferase